MVELDPGYKSLIRDLRVQNAGSQEVIDAMSRVPRRLFVPSNLVINPNLDEAIQLFSGASISEPSLVACMLTLLNLRPGDKVLEIGTGSGWNCAIMSEIVLPGTNFLGRTGAVISYEINPASEELARINLAKKQIWKTVQVFCGDGLRADFKKEEFDGIMVTAAIPKFTDRLKKMLTVNGRMVAPVGTMEDQFLSLLTRTVEDTFIETVFKGVLFHPAISAEAFSEEEARLHLTPYNIQLGLPSFA